MQQVFSGRMSTRGGAFVIGVGAALLAAILLVVYLNRYRNSVKAGAVSAPVLVAKSLIPKGTSGSVIAQQELFRTVSIAHSDIKTGAITDPAYLNGRVAVSDIFPGQQITTADVSAGLTDSIASQLTGTQRGLALSVAGARGLVGFVSEGDHVDIYYETGASGGNTLGLLASDITVLRTPTKDAPVVLRADALLAEKLAVASDSGTLWFLLRPGAGAHVTPKKAVTSQELISLIESER
jgi:Flp pilus assembly protein CpaB